MTGDVRLAADWDFAPNFSLNPNIGFAGYEGDERDVFAAVLAAVTLSYAPRPAIILFIDLGVQGPETAGGKTGATFDGGIAYIVGHHVQLDVSAGTRVLGRLGPQPFIGAGLSVRSR